MADNFFMGALVGLLLIAVLVIVLHFKKQRDIQRKINEIDRLAEAGDEDRLWPERPRGMPFNHNPPLTKAQAERMRPKNPPPAPPPAPPKKVIHEHRVYDGRVDRTMQPGRSQVPGSTNQPAAHYDPLHPANPISPISPFNPINQIQESTEPERRRDPEPTYYEPSSPSPSYSSSDSGGSSSDSGSSSSSSD